MAARSRPSAKDDLPSVAIAIVDVFFTRGWTTLIISAVITVSIELAPKLADARTGDGSSFGSRGSETFWAPPADNTAPYSASPTQQNATSPQQVVPPP
jgi:hypothetical protein